MRTYLCLNKSSIDEKYFFRQIEVGLIKVIFSNSMEVGLMKKILDEMEAGLMIVNMHLGRLLTYQRQVRH